jgi:hypothetical protein
MNDAADNRSLECSTCGAVWITPSPLTGVDGSDGSADGSHSCLQCGGDLLSADVTQEDAQEIGQ